MDRREGRSGGKSEGKSEGKSGGNSVGISANGEAAARAAVVAEGDGAFGARAWMPSRLLSSIAVVLPLSLAVGAHAQELKGDAKAAENKVAMCIGCHGIGGYKASFPEVFSVPMIAGQSAKYLENALIAYRKGDRSHPTMQAIAGGLSDQDIADLAAYYSGKR
ncbi:MAG: cytochrome c [Lautropia sp.]